MRRSMRTRPGAETRASITLAVMPGKLNFRSGIISGDVNGDGQADLQSKVNGVTSLRVGDSCDCSPT
ncbi:hypothetical protein EMEDMD4_670006 [Sinorhizobium medicae]|uniref:VCBS repeat-containing protein n=1 Tax=Sinorhizobium medicae TaxID=110321 RepID=A0A508X6W4_9HYPH|nr:hypothetical protein EMEDMD4_670006 [Sinorhizobium medicae]